MKRPEKEVIILEVADKMKRAQGVYFTEFQGMTVAQSSQLRDEFRKAGIEYQVVKNTLIKKAIERANLSDKLYAALKNTTGVVFSYDDPIAPAKIIKKFAADNEKLKFKMASVDGTVFESKQLAELSTMAGRAENIARAIGTINNVVASVPSTINAVMRNLVNVLDQVAKQKAA